MALTGWLPPFAVAAMWTGDTTVAPLDGELTLTLCPIAILERINAPAAQERRGLKADFKAIKEDFDEGAEEVSENKWAYALCKTTSHMHRGITQKESNW